MAPIWTRLLCIAILLMTRTVSADAQAPVAGTPQAADPIRYTVSFPAPHTHYMDVSAIVPTGGRADVELMMAVWTPGSYLVREYERNIERVTATGAGGRALAVDKSDKNRWRVATGGAPAVTVSYRVYGREMSVRTNWVEASFALINGAPTFLTLADLTPRPHEVILNPAAGWRRSMTGLPPFGGGEHRYRAADFDTLVDSPILLGNPAVYEFTVDGKPHYLVNEGEAGIFDGQRAARDFEAVVREHRRFWGELPYDKYVVLNVMSETANNGLEHKNSTVLMTSRWATRTRSAYLAWLSIASHELFHAWNVKRLRPAEMVPYDYSRPQPTPLLWVSEGITDYYADLALVRGKITTEEDFYEATTGKIQNVAETVPVALEDASLSTWIAPRDGTGYVYYPKGSLAGLLLDVLIRDASDNAASLDGVLRELYQTTFKRGKGFTTEEFWQAVSRAARGRSFTEFAERYVDGRDPLPYGETLALAGMSFRADSNRVPRLGVNTVPDSAGVRVASVAPGGSAAMAGVEVGDLLLRVGDVTVMGQDFGPQFRARYQSAREGAPLSVVVRRGEETVTLTGELRFDVVVSYALSANPAASEKARRVREGILTGR